MSFGYSVSDFVAVGQLAWTVYKSCKEAPESFANISAELLSLHAVLKEVGELLVDQPLSASKQHILATVTSGCQDVLKDLQALKKKYERLSLNSKRTWDRMRWGMNDVAELRQRLTSNTVLLTAFMSTCPVVVERKLNTFVQEFRNGRREGSVITVASIESLTLDDKQMWREIRKELENIGISVAAFHANKRFILKWFQNAVENGALDEEALDSDSRSFSDYNEEQYIYSQGPGCGVQSPDTVLEQSFEPDRLEPNQTRTPSTEVRLPSPPEPVKTLRFRVKSVSIRLERPGSREQEV